MLYVGRLSPVRKCDLVPLLHAFSTVAAAHAPQPRLVIAGDDTVYRMAGTLMAHAAALGCAEAVTVCANPTHEEKQDLYRAADVFVSPSDNAQETFGITIVEAMAAGLPVVTSDWNGYRELVVHGRTGSLVPTYWSDLGTSFDVLSLSDSLIADGALAAATAVDSGALARCLCTLVGDRSRRLTMGEGGSPAVQEPLSLAGGHRAVRGALGRDADRAAREADRHPPAAGVTMGTMRRMFAHYPSHTLGDHAEVRRADETVVHQDAVLSLSRLSSVPEYAGSRARCSDVSLRVNA